MEWSDAIPYSTRRHRPRLCDMFMIQSKRLWLLLNKSLGGSAWIQTIPIRYQSTVSLNNPRLDPQPQEYRLAKTTLLFPALRSHIAAGKFNLPFPDVLILHLMLLAQQQIERKTVTPTPRGSTHTRTRTRTHAHTASRLCGKTRNENHYST